MPPHSPASLLGLMHELVGQGNTDANDLDDLQALLASQEAAAKLREIAHAAEVASAARRLAELQRVNQELLNASERQEREHKQANAKLVDDAKLRMQAVRGQMAVALAMTGEAPEAARPAVEPPRGVPSRGFASVVQRARDAQAASKSGGKRGREKGRAYDRQQSKSSEKARADDSQDETKDDSQDEIEANLWKVDKVREKAYDKARDKREEDDDKPWSCKGSKSTKKRHR